MQKRAGHLVIGIQNGAAHEGCCLGFSHVQVEALAQVGQGGTPTKAGQAGILHEGYCSQDSLCYAARLQAVTVSIGSSKPLTLPLKVASFGSTTQ